MLFPMVDENLNAHLWWYRARLVDVIDGDTIDVDIDLGFSIWRLGQRLRLLGINAPEMHGATREAGEQAKEFLTGLLASPLRIQTAKMKSGEGGLVDNFGRILANVYAFVVPLGPIVTAPYWTYVNAVMLDTGHAVPFMPTTP